MEEMENLGLDPADGAGEHKLEQAEARPRVVDSTVGAAAVAARSAGLLQKKTKFVCAKIVQMIFEKKQMNLLFGILAKICIIIFWHAFLIFKKRAFSGKSLSDFFKNIF